MEIIELDGNDNQSRLDRALEEARKQMRETSQKLDGTMGEKDF